MSILTRIQAELLYLALTLADVYVLVKRRYNQRQTQTSSLAAATDSLTQAYCKFNQHMLAPRAKNSGSTIVIDCFPIPLWVAANSVLANRLSERFGAEICSFGESRRDVFTDVLYRAFGCERHFLVATPVTSRKRRKHLFLNAFEGVRTKAELFAWAVDGVQIGDEVYETYLRQFSKPTAEVGSFKCYYVMFMALNYYLFFDEFFDSSNVAAVVLSHDIYVSMGVLAKIAWRNGISVYLSNSVELKRTTRPDEKYAEFVRYRDYFSCLSELERSAALEWGKNQLERRLGGAVGVNMAYSTKSAYTPDVIERQTTHSDKIKIVIATHCFFDNPRAYGGMLFIDFFEWISFLGRISELTDYDWYIKTHRDFLPGTMDAIKRLVSMYPKLTLINPETSWHQLREEGISVALTCYGSVGHELPLLGYKVINAGYNPHIAYSFNWHPKTLDEYEQLLLNLEGIGEIRELDSIYEFYFVHYKLAKQGGFLFESYDEMGAYCVDPGVHSTKIFERVIAGGSAMQDEAKAAVDTFLDFGAFSEAEMLLSKSHGPRIT